MNTNDTQINLPVIAGAALMFLGSLATGFFNMINKRAERTEKEMPTIQEMWAEMRSLRDDLTELSDKLEREVRARSRAETMLRSFLDVFMRYVNRVKDGGDVDLTDTESKALTDAQKYLG